MNVKSDGKIVGLMRVGLRKGGQEGIGRTHSDEKYQTRIEYEESTDFRGLAENGGG